jgi:hypothetical protein
LIVSDITVETTGQRLKENLLGLLLYADELDGFFGNMGRYNNGRDLPHYIAIHNGKPLTIDRKTSGGLTHIPRPSLAVCGGIQPAILRERLKENPDYFHSGFIARFLIAMPPVEAVKLNRHELPDDDRWSYERFVTDILSARENALVDGKVAPMVFPIASSAWDTLVEYQHRHAEMSVYESDGNATIEGKFLTNAARLALILHVASLTERGIPLSDLPPVPCETMRNACIVTEWFTDEAKRNYATFWGARVDGELTTDQREVMQVLQRHQPATLRELKRASRVIQKMEDIDGVLRELIQAGRIQDKFRNDKYHKNGVLEYKISTVDTVAVDTMSKNTGEFRHNVNVNTVNTPEYDFSDPPGAVDFSVEPDPESAVDIPEELPDLPCCKSCQRTERPCRGRMPSPAGCENFAAREGEF